MTRSIRRALQAAAAAVLLSVAGQAAAAMTAGGSPGSVSAPARVAADVTGAAWMAVDPATRRVLVLRQAEGALAELLVLDPAGQLLAAHALPTVTAQGAQVHYFSAQKRLAIATFEVQQDEALSGSAVLVDVESGALQPVQAALGAIAADPARGQLLVADGGTLHLVDLQTGLSRREWRFEAEIEEMLVGPRGAVHFLQAGLAEDPDHIVTLAAGSFEVAQRQVVNAESDWHALLGVDEERGRAFVLHAAGAELDAQQSCSISVEDREGRSRALQLAGEDLCEATLFAPVPGSPWLYVHEPGFGRLHVFDAETLQPVQSLQGFHGQYVGRDSGGELLVVSGRELQRRHARSFGVLQSVRLEGPVHLAALDAEARLVHLVVEAAQVGRWTDRMEHLDLDQLQILP